MHSHSHAHSHSTCEPFWGPVTSSVDWCEQNYVHSCYIAEFWNTLSSLCIILPALIGLLSCYRHNLERRFYLKHLAVVVVGLGSVAFHATLQYSMQLLDEIPMMYAALIYLFTSLETTKEPKYPMLPLFLTGFAVCSTLSGALLGKQPLVFQTLWVALMLILIYKQTRLFMVTEDPEARRMFKIGLSLYAAAGVCWLIDTHACPSLESMPLRDLFQLHALWHVMSGVATYYGIIWATLHRERALQERYVRLGWCMGLPCLDYTTPGGETTPRHTRVLRSLGLASKPSLD